MASHWTVRSGARKTRRSVIISDRIAQAVISVGGIATIAAVCAVAVFLVWVSVPLFFPGELHAPSVTPWTSNTRDLIYVAVDDEVRVALVLGKDGKAVLIDLADGAVVAEKMLVEGGDVTALAPPRAGESSFAAATGDGSLILGQVAIEPDLVTGENADAYRDLASGSRKKVGDELWVRTDADKLIRYRLVTKVDQSVKLPVNRVIALDVTTTRTKRIICCLDESGEVSTHQFSTRSPLVRSKSPKMTSRVLVKAGTVSPLPVSVGFNAQASHLILVSEKGNAWWIKNADSAGAPQGIPGKRGEFATSGWLLGKETFVLGSRTGEVSSGFFAREASDGGSDFRFHWTQTLQPGGTSPVAAIGPSAVSRLVAVASQNGQVFVYLPTNGREVCSNIVEGIGKPLATCLAPNDDAVVVVGEEGIARMALDPSHPEATWSSLFGKVWYEGYPAPRHMWQTDTAGGAEPKFGLVPLIFGTLKATLYSMLFATPIALLAAIYTSEFLKPSVRSRIKPVIELMAGLPSVVLGFFGAIVLGPWVGRNLSATLAALAVVPFTFLLAGHLWQLLPPAVTLRLSGWRWLTAALVLPLGLWFSSWLGPAIERDLFNGDLLLWLDGGNGGSASGWMLIFFPVSVILMNWISAAYLNPFMQTRLPPISRFSAAIVALGRFAAETLLILAVVWGLAQIMSGLGFDPRGTVVDSYVQRNALIVGFVMGFAIIPIIYTIADDALTTVPDHLRSASLGAGATIWQTTVRVVVPTAMSGLFSAIIIGLGRAVGETMIVLMAAGNTPILDWNIFNGFRPLSANIATELPEVDQGTTHYRVLFLSAVVLLALTSVLNTLAEFVRLRFRRRAFQL